MKYIKKFLSVLVALASIAVLFSGCSSAQKSSEITSDTLLVAYYANADTTFLSFDEQNGESGFDLEIFKAVFDDIKNDCTNYAFVQVEDDYVLGEDAAYTDDEGNEYIAYMAIGGNTKNTDTVNYDCSFTDTLIENRIIAVTNSDSVKSYADFSGKNIATVTAAAQAALEKNASIYKACASVTAYDDAETALTDLDADKVDAVIIDEFTYMPMDKSYTVLDGELEAIEYAIKTAKYDRLADDLNEAIYELKSADYNDADEFTPIVEKYFGYNASSFDYQPLD